MQDEDWTYGRLVTWRPTVLIRVKVMVVISPISPGDLTVYQKFFFLSFSACKIQTFHVVGFNMVAATW